jgi:assimilatory nitrate reductase catalytic subunit
LESLTWWACAEGGLFRRYEIAGRRVPGDRSAWAQKLLSADSAADWIEYEDAGAGTYRAAHLHEERLESCLFVAPFPELPSRSWLATLFEKRRITSAERTGLLAGRPADSRQDGGPTVCACFGVGRNTIEAAIAQGLRDVRSIGTRLKAGTNCGSCVPELDRMIALAPHAPNGPPRSSLAGAA